MSQGYSNQPPFGQQASGYLAQSPHAAQQASFAPLPQSASRQTQQEVKFYKSSAFGFASAVGRFQRDYQKMAQQGWQVKYFNIAGVDLLLRRYVVAIYERY